MVLLWVGFGFFFSGQSHPSVSHTSPKVTCRSLLPHSLLLLRQPVDFPFSPSGKTRFVSLSHPPRATTKCPLLPCPPPGGLGRGHRALGHWEEGEEGAEVTVAARAQGRSSVLGPWAGSGRARRAGTDSSTQERGAGRGWD